MWFDYKERARGHVFWGCQPRARLKIVVFDQNNVHVTRTQDPHLGAKKKLFNRPTEKNHKSPDKCTSPARGRPVWPYLGLLRFDCTHRGPTLLFLRFDCTHRGPTLGSDAGQSRAFGASFGAVGDVSGHWRVFT